MQSALSKVPGVLSADVKMPDSATVKVQPGKVSQEQLIEAVKKAGFNATVKPKTS